MMTTTPPRSSRAGQSLLLMAAFVIVVAGLKLATPLLVPFLLSVFIAIICAPPLFWLQRFVPSWLALLTVLLAIFIFWLSVVLLVGGSIQSFTEQLPFYQQRLGSEMVGLVNQLEGFGIVVSETAIREALDPGAAMNLVGRFLSGFGGLLTNAFLILLTVIFILLEASALPAKLQSIWAERNASNPAANDHLRLIANSVQSYMGIKTGISLVTGAVITLCLSLIGVDYPLLWGLLAFLLNYVPNIGSIIAAVPAVMLAFIQLGAGSAGLVAGLYVVVNVLVGSVIEPRVMGKGLGLSSLVVFLSLVFWGWVFGPVGMLLSVPLTMIAKIILAGSESGHWVAVLLSEDAGK